MTMSAALDASRRLDFGKREGKGNGWGGVRGLLGRHDMIQMLERRHGYFPKVFAWRRRRYDVYAVERCWTITRPSLRGRVERYCFRVRARSHAGNGATDEVFEIYQEVQSGNWHMGRRLS